MDYVILTESTADFPKDMIKTLGIYVEPMTYIIDGEEFSDKPVVTGTHIKAFYDELRSGKNSSTSQINEARFCEIFKEHLENEKDILYIAFSSGLSGTYNQAMNAAEIMKEQYPQRKIIVIDSLCASYGEGLLVYHAAMMKNSGKTIEETAQWVEENKLNLCHWFTVDDLNHLKRGGRVSPTVALIGTMLGIKPILHVDNDGKLIPVSKVRGRKQSIDALIKKMEETAINPQEQTVFISHGDCIEDVKYLESEIRKKFHTKIIYTNYIGPVIGTHSGPGTLALYFLGEHR